jgi:hypothetical protein
MVAAFNGGICAKLTTRARSLTHAPTLAVINGIGHASQFEGGHFINSCARSRDILDDGPAIEAIAVPSPVGCQTLAKGPPPPS